MANKASGKFGKFLVFRCGKFVRATPRLSSENPSGAQMAQRELFLDASTAWSNDVSSFQKNLWKQFAINVNKHNGMMLLHFPGFDIPWQIGQKDYDVCIETVGWNGYQYFSSCYMKFGPGGWPEYPSPPSIA